MIIINNMQNWSSLYHNFRLNVQVDPLEHVIPFIISACDDDSAPVLKELYVKTFYDSNLFYSIFSKFPHK